jgi:hypothetical protein
MGIPGLRFPEIHWNVIGIMGVVLVLCKQCPELLEIAL